MKIVHITAGAGGRICGSCLHDNALVRALRARGGDAILVPAYVPTTTDEENVAERKVVMGGVNVWLQQNVPLFRRTPAFVDRPLDSRGLLDWLSSRTGGARPGRTLDGLAAQHHLRAHAHRLLGPGAHATGEARHGRHQEGGRHGADGRRRRRRRGRRCGWMR
jgi:hypothetical protein